MTVLMLVYTCRRALKYLLIVDGRGSSTTAPARHVSGGAPACGRPMSARSRRLSQLGPDVRTPAASRLPAPAGQGCHGPCPPTRPAAGPARETSRATSSGPRTTSPCSRKSPVPTHHGTMIIRMAGESTNHKTHEVLATAADSIPFRRVHAEDEERGASRGAGGGQRLGHRL